ncbi:unconventional prefoldin RPB5 interactor-like protein [Cimex lectularius]|uniref:Unconventional prefoldin RPB5 interactor n=1 Tax=Cimex lectularius TaxID=79782 RepID=A0A8I6SAK9_CIMLE|nr:unconventional prefoldin RPB5 interactor-like protein [Cimex lectularius]
MNVHQPDKLPFEVQRNLLEALMKNRKSFDYWSERKNSYEELKKSLKIYLGKLRHQIYAPIGKRAFMKGTVVHTNDVTVAVGDGYFFKVSSASASEICERRLKEIDEMLDKIKKERELLENNLNVPKKLEAFGNEERQEIIEPYDEESEKSWREKHKESVRAHKQKLAELRNKIKESKGNTEEDIMKHLDLLEMQEELEEEIDRLGGESDSDDYDDDDDSIEEDVENEIQSDIPDKPVKTERRVTFDLSDRFQDISLDNKDSKNLTAIGDSIEETLISKRAIEQKETRPISKFRARKLKN